MIVHHHCSVDENEKRCSDIHLLARYTIVMELIPDEAGQLNCVETWPRLPQLAYGSFINIMQFVIPFATMFVCYTRSHEHATVCSTHNTHPRIMIRLRQRAQGKPGARTVRQRQEEAARTARVSHQLQSRAI